MGLSKNSTNVYVGGGGGAEKLQRHILRYLIVFINRQVDVVAEVEVQAFHSACRDHGAPCAVGIIQRKAAQYGNRAEYDDA